MAGGRRGPPPLPTKTLEERESWRAKIKKKEPQLKVESPACPAWLPVEAQEEWKRIVPVLLEMRILSEADRVCLENYCLTYARVQQAQAFIAKNGFSYETKTGWRKFPEVGVIEQAQTLIKGFLQEFGLSPSSRTRVAASEPERDAIPSDVSFFKGRKDLKVIG